jgi:hypothetical protein
MLRSESEARETWCPFARVGGNNRLNNMQASSSETIPEAFRCIGSRCMAWREVQTSHLKGEAGKAVQGHGYCGLGGPLAQF